MMFYSSEGPLWKVDDKLSNNKNKGEKDRSQFDQLSNRLPKRQQIIMFSKIQHLENSKKNFYGMIKINLLDSTSSLELQFGMEVRCSG
jgi:hypothetical protein